MLEFSKSIGAGKKPFSAYQDYLKTVKDKLSPTLYEFTLNPDKHGGDESMHDAWIEEISIVEKRDKENDGQIDIRLKFIGPQHDRFFEFYCSNVESYQLGLKERRFASGHGDILCFEVSIENEWTVIAFWLATQDILFVKATNIEVKESLISI